MRSSPRKPPKGLTPLQRTANFFAGLVVGALIGAGLLFLAWGDLDFNPVRVSAFIAVPALVLGLAAAFFGEQVLDGMKKIFEAFWDWH